MAPIRVTVHQCPFCRQRPYVQRGRLNQHLRTKHPKEFKEDIDKLVDPSARFTPPPAPVGTVPDGYEQLVQLSRPLTSLETRLKMTNKVIEQDYDSFDEGEDLDDVSGLRPMEIDSENLFSSSAQHQLEYPDNILIIGINETYRRSCFQDLWKPFRSGYEFKLARWMVDANLSKKSIDRFFNKGLARTPPPVNPGKADGVCYTSAYTFSKLLDDLDPDLNIHSWKPKAVEYVGTGLVEFRYCGIEAMIRSIFKQPSHEPYMVYKPIKEYDGPDKRYRLFSGLHTGDWWWRMQVCSFLLVDFQVLIE